VVGRDKTPGAEFCLGGEYQKAYEQQQRKYLEKKAAKLGLLGGKIPLFSLPAARSAIFPRPSGLSDGWFFRTRC